MFTLTLLFGQCPIHQHGGGRVSTSRGLASLLGSCDFVHLYIHSLLLEAGTNKCEIIMVIVLKDKSYILWDIVCPGQAHWSRIIRNKCIYIPVHGTGEAELYYTHWFD